MAYIVENSKDQAVDITAIKKLSPEGAGLLSSIFANFSVIFLLKSFSSLTLEEKK